MQVADCKNRRPAWLARQPAGTQRGLRGPFSHQIQSAALSRLRCFFPPRQCCDLRAAPSQAADQPQRSPTSHYLGAKVEQLACACRRGPGHCGRNADSQALAQRAAQGGALEQAARDLIIGVSLRRHSCSAGVELPPPTRRAAISGVRGPDAAQTPRMPSHGATAATLSSSAGDCANAGLREHIIRRDIRRAAGLGPVIIARPGLGQRFRRVQGRTIPTALSANCRPRASAGSTMR